MHEKLTTLYITRIYNFNHDFVIAYNEDEESQQTILQGYT